MPNFKRKDQSFAHYFQPRSGRLRTIEHGKPANVKGRGKVIWESSQKGTFYGNVRQKLINTGRNT